jgi:hypothetical protein
MLNGGKEAVGRHRSRSFDSIEELPLLIWLELVCTLLNVLERAIEAARKRLRISSFRGNIDGLKLQKIVLVQVIEENLPRVVFLPILNFPHDVFVRTSGNRHERESRRFLVLRNLQESFNGRHAGRPLDKLELLRGINAW